MKVLREREREREREIAKESYKNFINKARG